MKSWMTAAALTAAVAFMSACGGGGSSAEPDETVPGVERFDINVGGTAYPTVASDRQGNLVAAWIDNGDLRRWRHLDTTTGILGDPVTANSDSSPCPEPGLDIAVNPYDWVIIAWSCINQLEPPRSYTRIFTSNGEPWTDVIEITDEDSLGFPNLGFESTGAFFLSWGYRYQRFDLSGNPLAGFGYLDSNGFSSAQSDAESNGSGQLYFLSRPYNDIEGLYFGVFSWYQPLTKMFNIDAGGTLPGLSKRYQPVIARSKDVVAIAWSETAFPTDGTVIINGEIDQIKFRLFDSLGNPLTEVIPLNRSGTDVQVMVDNEGRTLITWKGATRPEGVLIDQSGIALSSIKFFGPGQAHPAAGEADSHFYVGLWNNETTTYSLFKMSPEQIQTLPDAAQ